LNVERPTTNPQPQAGSGDARGLVVQVEPDSSSAGRAAAQVIIQAIQKKPNLILCVATGSSPIPAYHELAAHATDTPDLFRGLRILKLDEWMGLDPDDPASCEVYIRSRLLRPLNIDERRYVGFELGGGSSESDCRRISDWLERNGPIDLSVLGLGDNGHLGLNEPGATLAPFCHEAQLAETSRAHSMLAVARRQPRSGVTLGMGDLLRSRHILLIVTGAHKRTPLRRLLQREVSTQFPASLLWLHARVTCVCDEAAAGSQCLARSATM
jgi:galactosamine-6-phosphate isomerase